LGSVVLFLEVIAKNLARRKTRTTLTVAGLAAAVAATTTLLNIAWAFAGSAADSYRSRDVDLVVVRAGVAERITSSLSASLAGRLAALPEVAGVDGSLTDMVSFGQQSLVGIPLHGLDPAGFAAGRLTIVSGSPLTSHDRHAVLLGSGLARALKNQPGQEVEIERTPFRIAGVFETDNVLESNTAVAPLADVQELMDRPGQVSEFQIRVGPSYAGDTALCAICRNVESLRDQKGRSLGFKALPTRQFVESDTETKLATGMAWGTSIITVLLSLVGMLNTMLMSVLERTRELGILRAVGWTRGRILRLILGESLAIGAVGAAAGVVLAGVLLQILAAWSFTRNVVQPGLLSGPVLVAISLMLAAAVAGSFYPAYRGASVLPTEALRAD
jgi:putative ABC transport system permease protein